MGRTLTSDHDNVSSGESSFKPPLQCFVATEHEMRQKQWKERAE